MLHVDELNSSIGIAIGLGFGVLMIVQGFGLVAVVAVAVAIWQLGKIVVELDEIAHCAPVEEVGVAVPQLVTGDESADEYYLHINGKRLVLSREQYGWLVPGGPYRVHLLPRCRKVVSVEVLPGWRAEPNRVTERPKRFRIRFPTGE